MTSICFSNGNNSVEISIITDHHTFQYSRYTYQAILNDFIVLGIVSESQTQILPRPIERAEVKFSLSDTFRFIFTMVSNRFVPECFSFSFFFFFSNPCHFENHFGLFIHIFVHFVPN